MGRSSVVIGDPNVEARRQLVQSFDGSWSVSECSRADDAERLVRSQDPALLVLELHLESGTGFDVAAALRNAGFRGRIVLLTWDLSVAAAVTAHRLGFAALVPKPATANDVLAAIVAPPRKEPGACMSLERAVWEHMWRGVLSATTKNDAARRLAVQARSLRRMLARYAPSR